MFQVKSAGKVLLPDRNNPQIFTGGGRWIQMKGTTFVVDAWSISLTLSSLGLENPYVNRDRQKVTQPPVQAGLVAGRVWWTISKLVDDTAWNIKSCCCCKRKIGENVSRYCVPGSVGSHTPGDELFQLRKFSDSCLCVTMVYTGSHRILPRTGWMVDKCLCFG